MDFKWKLSRPGIELEFETGSIGEAIGMLEEEGTKISEVFGFTMGNSAGSTALSSGTVSEPSEPKTRKPRANKDAAAAVAPPPMPVPTEAPAAAPTSATLPPNALTIPEDGGIPTFLDRTAAAAAAVAPPPLLPSPPVAPLPPSAPPVGVLGPKVVKALDILREGKADGGQALSDWLAGAGLTQKGANYDDACRALLMISDEKLKGVAGALGVAA